MKEKLTRYNANTIVNNIFPPFSFQTKQKQINLFYKFSVQLNLRGKKLCNRLINMLIGCIPFFYYRIDDNDIYNDFVCFPNFIYK